MSFSGTAIADQVPDVELTSEPRRLRSGWLNSIKQLQAVYRH
jgi:cholest-4-en-3-one 26-monooxygenase